MTDGGHTQELRLPTSLVSSLANAASLACLPVPRGPARCSITHPEAPRPCPFLPQGLCTCQSLSAAGLNLCPSAVLISPPPGVTSQDTVLTLPPPPSPPPASFSFAKGAFAGPSEPAPQCSPVTLTRSPSKPLLQTFLWVHRPVTGPTQSGILPSHKKEQSAHTRCSRDAPWKP